jgi:hypothetical protein
MNQILNIYVEVIDEPIEDWFPVSAKPIGDELYVILPTEHYLPEVQSWAFVPGDTVRLALCKLYDGSKGLATKHPNPDAVRVWVKCSEPFAPELRATYAVPVGEGRYEILATPHYTSEQLWEFPPGSVVRLMPRDDLYFGEKHWLAVA